MEFSLTHLEYGLKNLLHLMCNTDIDVRLLKDALHTWVQRRNETEGDKYRFDTIVLRAFHFLNMPNEAIQVSLRSQLYSGIALSSQQSITISFGIFAVF